MHWLRWAIRQAGQRTLLCVLTLAAATGGFGPQRTFAETPRSQALLQAGKQRLAPERRALQASQAVSTQVRSDSSEHPAVQIRAEVEVRGYYHRAFAPQRGSALSRGGYFRHRRSRLVLESAQKGRIWGRLAVAAQPEVGEAERVLTGDKRYFGTNLMLDVDEAFVQASLGPFVTRLGRQYVQLGLSPDRALVVDDYDFTSDDHAEAIQNALRVDLALPGGLHALGLISRTRQGLDKPYGGDPVPYGSRSLLAGQLVYRRNPQQALGLYFAADHNVVDVPCDRWYTGGTAFFGRPHWNLYAEAALMTRQRPDGRVDRGVAWYLRFERHFHVRDQRFRMLVRHAAFSSDNPRTRHIDETFLSAFNHFRLGESLDHRKTDGKSVLEVRLGWVPLAGAEIAFYADWRAPFAEHPFVRGSYPRPRYDWTGDELGVVASLQTSQGQVWGGISLYQPHNRFYFDRHTQIPREALLLLGMNVFIGGQ